MLEGWGWREAAVVEALGAGSGGGDDLLRRLLSLVRAGRPRSSQTILRGVGFRKALRIVEQKTVVEDVLRGTIGVYEESLHAEHLYAEDDEVPSLYLGWYSFSWEGVEMVCVPPVHRTAATVVFVSSCARVAHEVAAFVWREARVRVPKNRCSVFLAGMWREAPELEAEIDGTSWEESCWRRRRSLGYATRSGASSGGARST